MVDFEKRVIEVLGKNHTSPIQFDGDIGYNEPYGLYTYRGGVHIIKTGEEWSFDHLSSDEQKNLVKRFDSKKWKINKRLQ